MTLSYDGEIAGDSDSEVEGVQPLQVLLATDGMDVTEELKVGEGGTEGMLRDGSNDRGRQIVGENGEVGENKDLGDRERAGEDNKIKEMFSDLGASFDVTIGQVL
ncbi:hypothetical protein AMTR_s00095p00123210 [Amborella trichopoda]|uniref:Uncharacterized protein n=1 Tax=Amborella trichopoda TaxID=13333 RepID=W1NRL5_AMBTC|nr:hypothetical protein AMTR_s00095p00123210 [Amborella trichopoda]